MIEAKELAEFLSTHDNLNKVYKNHNDDEDFGKVLEFSKGHSLETRKVRYSDGKDHVLSFV